MLVWNSFLMVSLLAIRKVGCTYLSVVTSSSDVLAAIRGRGRGRGRGRNTEGGGMVPDRQSSSNTQELDLTHFSKQDRVLAIAIDYLGIRTNMINHQTSEVWTAKSFFTNPSIAST